MITEAGIGAEASEFSNVARDSVAIRGLRHDGITPENGVSGAHRDPPTGHMTLADADIIAEAAGDTG
jgi:hypothetical protein